MVLFERLGAVSYSPSIVTNVTFLLRSSINVRLTESSLYNRVCTKMFPKMVFLGVMLGVGPKIFGGKYMRPYNCAFRSRSDAPCSSIMYGYSYLP